MAFQLAGPRVLIWENIVTAIGAAQTYYGARGGEELVDSLLIEIYDWPRVKVASAVILSDTGGGGLGVNQCLGTEVVETF